MIGKVLSLKKHPKCSSTNKFFLLCHLSVSRADNDNLLPSPPKRNRLDKNIKETIKESEESEQGGLPIQCPICLESLDEVNN